MHPFSRSNSIWDVLPLIAIPTNNSYEIALLESSVAVMTIILTVNTIERTYFCHRHDPVR